MTRRKVLLASLLIVLMIPVCLLGLISSESGSRWLLQRVFSNLPGKATVQTIEGRLIDRVQISDINYQSDTESIAIDRIIFAWQAKKLLRGTLKIIEITVQGVNASLTETRETPDQSPIEFPTELSVPMQLVIENVQLTDWQLQIGDQLHTLKNLRITAATEDDQLNITLHEFDAKPLEVTAQVKIRLRQGFLLSLTTDWQFDAKENGLWRGATSINGDLNKLSFDNRLSSPFDMVLKGDIKNVLESPYLTARGDWRNLKWPVAAATPQIESQQGSLELTGLLNDYRITLAGQLAQADLPASDLSFSGKGRQDAMTIENLELKSTAGSFQLTGDISWQDAPVFDLTAMARNFNPSVVLPEIPGNLTLNSHVKGRLDGKVLHLDGEIKRLTGTLRGHAVAANGRLRLSGDQLEIDSFRIASGANKLAVDGNLGRTQDKLEIAVDMPNLGQLWPGLAGSLTGQGQLLGALKNPAVKFQAKGKQLLFAEHSAEQFAINIDYHPDANNSSEFHLSAKAIKSGGMVLTKLLVEGVGTQQRHQFTAAINSSYGDLSAALSGSAKAESWQGSFSKLNLTSLDGGRWHLDKNMDISVKQKAAGIDAVINESCLIQQAAFLCAQGRYLAEGDFNVKLKAAELPLSLVHGHLPEKMMLTGKINGDADVQRQRQLLTGRYRFDVPAGSTLQLQIDQKTQVFTFGAFLMSGKINREIMSADLNLALLGHDYVRGRLQLNTGKTQALSGQLAASMVEFDWIKPFVPKLSTVKGDLKADLTLYGTAVKPRVHGVMRFREGAAEIAGHDIEHINIEAVAENKSDRIRLLGAANSGDGSVKLDGVFLFDGDYQFALNAPAFPLTLLEPYLPEQVALKGIIDADAEIRQRSGLMTGHYRLFMPAGTKIINKSQQTMPTISLGASELTGQLNGKMLTSDIDVGLVGKDYIRGQLQLDTGESQGMDGHITASVVEFAPITPWIPEVTDLKGRLHADITLKGTSAKPVAHGSVHLANASADLVELGLGLREINLQALASDDYNHRIRIQGFAKSGTGVVRLDGFSQPEPGWPVELRLTGEDFEVAKLTEAEIAVSPELKLAIADGRGQLNGKLKIPKALIRLKQLPENSVNVSSDEIILGQEHIKEEAPVPINIGVNIDVEMGKNVSFEGLGLKTNLSGRLRINQEKQKLVMHGNVDMSKASYKSYGQDLSVRKGRFLFNGPVDNPWLDVEATRLSKNGQVTAILALSGPVKAPKTSIYSEPSLPESEALAYLITGRSLSQVSESEGNMIAGAALSYGLGQASWLVNKLGIDEFEVKEGETLQDTLVGVGQYLNPDFYVGAKVGLFNKQASLILRHKLTDSVNVETEAGESQRIKLNYEIDVD